MTLGSLSSAERRLSFIYALLDPETLQPRYVGKTRQTPAKRLKQHIDHAIKTNAPRHRDYWIRTLLERGLTPLVEIIETGHWTVDEADLREIHWIAGLRQLWADLTNMSAGGEGNRGHKWSPEASERLSKAMRRRFDNESEETKQKRSAIMKEIWATDDDLRARHSQSLSERWADPDYKARITMSAPEYRARMSAIATERSQLPEVRAMLSNNGRISNMKRRKCNDCDLIAPPAAMGNHLKGSKHSGYTDLHVQNTGGEYRSHAG